jgi:RNA polymerase subunit RPABC4/transcription elongation factor Spt4
MNWKCGNCGELIEGDFDTCWNCGTDRNSKKPVNKNEFDKIKKEIQNDIEIMDSNKCPACHKIIKKSMNVCPECNTQLKVIFWEIENDFGKKILFDSEDLIKKQLISGTLKLNNRSRKIEKILYKIEKGKKEYKILKEMKWKTLKDYANSVFSLQVLYNPIKAYEKRLGIIILLILAFITAICWNANILLSAGANLIVAILLSILLILLSPTIIGLCIASIIIGNFYNFPPLGLFIRTSIAIGIGAIVGGLFGFPIGYLIGYFIGKSKKVINIL